MTGNVTMWLFGVIIWATITLGLLRLRRWMLFYLFGAFGFVLLIAYGAAAFDIDTLIESVEAQHVAALSGLLSIPVSVAQSTGLAIPNHTGWAVFDIGLECSAILEMGVIVGLTGFYPAFRPARRALLGLTGLAATYVINLVRILIIVAIISVFGTKWVFVSHAVVGRVFFFTATIALYWFLMTRPTITFTGERVEELKSS